MDGVPVTMTMKATALVVLAAGIVVAGGHVAIAAGAPTTSGSARGSSTPGGSSPGTSVSGAGTQGTPAPSRNLTKTRPGSLLHTDKPWENPLDLRGELARDRDRELAKHYERMAELDVMATLAAEARDLALQERVEQVRRKEMLRHNNVMIHLVQAATAALARGSKP